MFLVFNKQKICTYLITIMTVILLFFIAQGTIIPQDSIDTSSNNTFNSSGSTTFSKVPSS